jgi:uncharacterized damage-inducible protein DinB
MTIKNFRQLADYNHWANLRLYGAALEMSEDSYRLPTGVFFGSLHGTLNHLLLTGKLQSRAFSNQLWEANPTETSLRWWVRREACG